MFKKGLFLCFCFSSAYAQQAFPTAGSNINGTGGNASFTIGLCNYTTLTGNSGNICQGIQHPIEIYTLTGIEHLTNLKINLNVFPNPTIDFLTLKIEGAIAQKLNYQVLDNQGKVIAQNPLVLNDTQIALWPYAAGTYFIQIIEHTTIIKTFKIIKN